MVDRDVLEGGYFTTLLVPEILERVIYIHTKSHFYSLTNHVTTGSGVPAVTLHSSVTVSPLPIIGRDERTDTAGNTEK